MKLAVNFQLRKSELMFREVWVTCPGSGLECSLLLMSLSDSLPPASSWVHVSSRHN